MGNITFMTTTDNLPELFSEGTLKKGGLILGISPKSSGPTVLIGEDSFAGTLLLEKRLCVALNKSGVPCMGQAPSERNCSAIGPAGDYRGKGKRLIKFWASDETLSKGMDAIAEQLNIKDALLVEEIKSAVKDLMEENPSRKSMKENPNNSQKRCSQGVIPQ
jgi:hypothetical protein